MDYKIAVSEILNGKETSSIYLHSAPYIAYIAYIPYLPYIPYIASILFWFIKFSTDITLRL